MIFQGAWDENDQDSTTYTATQAWNELRRSPCLQARQSLR